MSCVCGPAGIDFSGRHCELHVYHHRPILEMRTESEIIHNLCSYPLLQTYSCV